LRRGTIGEIRTQISSGLENSQSRSSDQITYRFVFELL
jgi:hypothetical protein